MPQPTPLPASPLDRSVPPTSAIPAPNFATVDPRQQDWTFEQFVEALKAVRARQKELKTQEADLLAKIAEKVEEKRKDLNKAEEVLQQLRGQRTTVRDSSSFDQSFSAKTDEKRPEKRPFEKSEKR